MSGSEAKTPDDPVVILGLLPPEAPLEEMPWPSARLGIASLVTPILAFVFGWMAMALTPQTPSSFRIVPDGFLWLVGFLALGVIAGTVLSIRSLWKRERWPILGVIGLLVNGGILLGVITPGMR